MEFNEFKILVKGLKAVYTSPNFLPDADSVRIWYKLLQDMSYEQLNLAIQKYMMTGKFPPTVAELRESAVSLVCESKNWSDGWEQFRRAVRNFGYNRPKEAFDSMDDITRQVVKRLGWKDLCESENLMQDRANFRIVYEQEQKRVSENAMLPPKLKNQIEKLQSDTIKALGVNNEQ